MAGGGDGTISTVAIEVSAAGKTLGILPLGTLNNFSKDLGIPQDLNDAVRTIAKGEVHEIDLAECNGRIFINNSSIGLYPKMVVRREQQQQKLGRGKWAAAFWVESEAFPPVAFLCVSIDGFWPASAEVFERGDGGWQSR